MKRAMMIWKTALLFSAVLLFGCGREPMNYYEEAQKALEAGDENGARQYLLHEIAQNDTPEAHLQYARLLGSQEEVAGVAAWHYRRYLEQLPNNDDVRDVRKLAVECEQKYMDYCIRLFTKKEYSSLEDLKFRLKLIEEHARSQKLMVERLELEKRNLGEQILEMREAKTKERRRNGK